MLHIIVPYLDFVNFSSNFPYQSQERTHQARQKLQCQRFAFLSITNSFPTHLEHLEVVIKSIRKRTFGMKNTTHVYF